MLRSRDGTCKLGPEAVDLLRKGGRSAALLLRVGPGALQVLLQRSHPLALRLRGVPRAVQLLLQALRPLAGCRQAQGASALRTVFKVGRCRCSVLRTSGPGALGISPAARPSLAMRLRLVPMQAAQLQRQAVCLSDELQPMSDIMPQLSVEGLRME